MNNTKPNSKKGVRNRSKVIDIATQTGKYVQDEKRNIHKVRSHRLKVRNLRNNAMIKRSGSLNSFSETLKSNAVKVKVVIGIK